MSDSAAEASHQFLFVTCQVGAERALKAEIARLWPEFRFAYSRPGFVTFKLPAEGIPADDFDLKSAFARAYGFSLGRVRGESREANAEQAMALVGSRRFDRLHVWSRDRRAAGDRGYLPGPTLADQEVAQLLSERLAPHAERPALLAPTSAGHLVLDCVQIDGPETGDRQAEAGPIEWWIGYHRAASITSCQPGGMWPVEIPEHAVSRAYLKLEEALRWSRLPICPGDQVAEIGAAPGGAAQALLDRGLIVVGIDPAQIDPRVLEHPNFVHIQKRGAEVRRREFRKTRWLLADLNVAPEYTLDTVEAIATHDEVHLHGLLLTLKLLDWKLAEELPAYLERIRGWGFDTVQARQLQTGRQEVCVAAQVDSAAARRRRKSLAGRKRFS